MYDIDTAVEVIRGILQDSEYVDEYEVSTSVIKSSGNIYIQATVRGVHRDCSMNVFEVRTNDVEHVAELIKHRLYPEGCVASVRLKATFDNVVLKVLKKERKKGNILMPDSQSDEDDFCVITSVGPDVTCFKVGEYVLRPEPAEYEWIDESDDDTVYLICPQDSIVARKA